MESITISLLGFFLFEKQNMEGDSIGESGRKNDNMPALDPSFSLLRLPPELQHLLSSLLL